jgi:hypothetical protein
MFQCGSYQSEEESGPVLQSLSPGSLENLNLTSSLDITLTFSRGLKIEILGQSNTEPVLEIFGPNQYYLGYNNGNWITKSGSGRDIINDEEEKLNLHSEACFKRWSHIVPQGDGDKCCEDCFYYRPIRGGFYFWDYGLCSNQQSAFDGKVVEVKSSCGFFEK